MKIKFTLFLALLNVITFYTLFNLQKRDELRSQTTAEAKLVAIPLAEIDSIKINGSSINQSRELKRTGAEWEITAPIEWSANPFAIQRILTQLQFMEPEVTFSVDEIQKSGQSLADYGLENPNMSITLSTSSQDYVLHIGNGTSMGNRLYILSPSQNKIFVARQSFFEDLTEHFDKLANPNIFDIPQFELSTLKIQITEPNAITLRLSKHDENWLFEAPIQTHANNSLVNSVITELSNLKIQSFTDPDHSPISHPSMKVTLRSQNKSRTLVIGKDATSGTEDPTYLAKLEGNPTLFRISADPILALKDAQEDLREKKVLALEPENVNHIAITFDEANSLSLQKLENSKWKIHSPNHPSEYADNPTIKKLISQLENLEAIEFVTDAPSLTDLGTFGLNNPQRTVDIKSPATKQTLLIGNIDNKTGLLFAKIEDRPYVYKVSPSILSHTPVSPLKFKDRTLSKVPSNSKIKSIRVTDLSSNKILLDQTLQTETQTWDENLKSLADPLKQSITHILGDLQALQVKEYIKDQFTETARLDDTTEFPWNLSIEYKVEAPGQAPQSEKNHTLYFSKRIGGSFQIGGSKEKSTTFAVTQNWIDNLQAFSM